MITLDNLYEEAERFLWENYRMRLRIPIDIEDDFPGAEGWYEYTAEAPRRICISQDMIIFGDDEVIYDVLRHELVHYALHRQGKQFADGEAEFEAELERHGIASTESTMVGIYHMYECKKCGGEIPHYEKVDVSNSLLITVCCDASFIDKNIKAVYTGKERIY